MRVNEVERTECRRELEAVRSAGASLRTEPGGAPVTDRRVDRTVIGA